MVDFDLYDEVDLPFLDKATEVGRMVSKNIIQQALDDDVMTDDEMISCANKLLSREVEKAIKQFNSGFDKSYIRNLKDIKAWLWGAGRLIRDHQWSMISITLNVVYLKLVSDGFSFIWYTSTYIMLHYLLY